MYTKNTTYNNRQYSFSLSDLKSEIFFKTTIAKTELDGETCRHITNILCRDAYAQSS